MKKLIFFCLVLLILCGCNNDKYSDFQHYNLNSYNPIYDYYIDDNQLKNVYAISDITPDNYEMRISGLFYQVTDDDYILLDKIESSNSVTKGNYYFYNNKLYVNACNGYCHYEYTLDQEKFIKKEIIFDTSIISNEVTIGSIIDIKKGYIYFSGLDSKNNGNKRIEIKCLLDTYKCELSDD